MPMTGYALRSAIRDILGHFWSESFGQIYSTLAGLTKVGLLWRQEVPRRRASLYEPTPARRTSRSPCSIPYHNQEDPHDRPPKGCGPLHDLSAAVCVFPLVLAAGAPSGSYAIGGRCRACSPSPRA
jgi:hypothetical protein